MEQQEQLTPTKLLMDVLENFGESEPNNIIVVYTNSDGHLITRTNTPMYAAIGLLECAKSLLYKLANL